MGVTLAFLAAAVASARIALEDDAIGLDDQRAHLSICGMNFWEADHAAVLVNHFGNNNTENFAVEGCDGACKNEAGTGLDFSPNADPPSGPCP